MEGEKVTDDELQDAPFAFHCQPSPIHQCFLNCRVISAGKISTGSGTPLKCPQDTLLGLPVFIAGLSLPLSTSS